MAHGGSSEAHDQRLYLLTLAALGVVFGDIGTSPLYAFRECFAGHDGVAATPANILGLLSLILWSLILVVAVKYLVFVLRADNRGEGGILALMALVVPQRPQSGHRRSSILVLGIFGAALLYGDGMITPAISVLSAVEGLELATPVLEPAVLPLAVAILVALFLLQRAGSERVGRVFGPVTLVWFLCLAGLGLSWIVRRPGVLVAINPVHGVEFFLRNGMAGFWVLGSVFLVVTGGEALYADMGHFGRRPIRLAWFALVFPALALNYLGQGALVLKDPRAVANPFYLLAPSWALYPLLLLATAATVIASQAVISGAFSLTRQALQLGYAPRLEVRHSSAYQIGQVYVPWVNWVLMLATVALVLGFRSSGNLAGAYGVAVASTMVVTTLLAFACARKRWKWPLAGAAAAAGFLAMDLAFFGAILSKLGEGGWVPLLVAVLAYILMTTWKQGRRLLSDRLREGRLPIEGFLDSLAGERLARVPGTAVFMDPSRSGTPRTLLHNIKHNKVVHKQVILLTVVSEEVPRVAAAERLEVSRLRLGFVRVVARYGFMETPDVPEILRRLEPLGFTVDLMQTTFFLGRETLIQTRKRGMARWRKGLFAFLARNAQRATLHFHIPPGRVVELGLQVEL